MVRKFADDTKMGGIVDSDENYLRVQQDRAQMGRMAEEWQVEFKLDKCEVLHFGNANEGKTFMVNGRALWCVVEQRNVGVQVHSSLKVESQVDRAVKKAFAFLKEGPDPKRQPSCSSDAAWPAVFIQL
eukprot:g18823.t1